MTEEDKERLLYDEDEPCTTSRDKKSRTDLPTEVSFAITTTPCSEQDTWIFDPVEALVQGRLPLEKDDSLQHAANELEVHLRTHLSMEGSSSYNNDGVTESVRRACHILQQHPEAAQVRYHPLLPQESASSRGCSNASGSSDSKSDMDGSHLYSSMPSSCCRRLAGSTSYPLTFFAATGSLPGVQAAYHAYPEAVAHADSWLGTPLHYACYHGAPAAVVRFLLERYPDAARVTNEQYQTPLHLACAGNLMVETPDLAVIQALLQHYSAAAQLADADGFTPLHLACQNAASSVPILQALTTASAGVVYASTRTLEKPLHVAARHRASPAVVQFLLSKDPAQAAATDDEFQTPLHKAAMAPTVSLDLVRALIRAYPRATAARDFHDERPHDLAVRLGGASPAVLAALLKGTGRDE